MQINEEVFKLAKIIRDGLKPIEELDWKIANIGASDGYGVDKIGSITISLDRKEKKKKER